jgi:hypothetical protein
MRDSGRRGATQGGTPKTGEIEEIGEIAMRIMLLQEADPGMNSTMFLDPDPEVDDG